MKPKSGLAIVLLFVGLSLQFVACSGLAAYPVKDSGIFAEDADLVVKAVNRLREMSPLWEMVQQGVDLNSVQWAAH